MKYDEYDLDDSEGRRWPHGAWVGVVMIVEIVACLLIALFAYLGDLGLM